MVLCLLFSFFVIQSFLCKFHLDIPTVSVNAGPIGDFTSPSLIGNLSYDRSAFCAQTFGYTSVYRICMGVASFFFVMMLMMLCVFSSRDPRAYIQNG